MPFAFNGIPSSIGKQLAMLGAGVTGFMLGDKPLQAQ